MARRSCQRRRLDTSACSIDHDGVNRGSYRVVPQLASWSAGHNGEVREHGCDVRDHDGVLVDPDGVLVAPGDVLLDHDDVLLDHDGVLGVTPS